MFSPEERARLALAALSQALVVLPLTRDDRLFLKQLHISSE